VFVGRVALGALAFLAAGGVHLADGRTVRVGGAFNVVGTEGHRVGVAGIFITEIPAGHDTSRFEPAPRKAHLSAVAAHRETTQKPTAASSISGGQQRSETPVCFHTKTVIECLGCAVRPAGTAISLVSHVADH